MPTAGRWLLWWAACAEVAAQTAPKAPTPPPQQVQVQATPLDESEQRQDAVAGMIVVDREELDRYGDTSVLDVLQRQSGVSVDGEQPRIRGLGGGYTLILVNGEPAPPGFSLEQLSPAEIERIEIVKGPSAEHGGVAGTINVVLRTPPRLRQREWRVNGSYRGLQPVGSTSLSWGDRIGDIGFQLPVSAYRWAGSGDWTSLRQTRTAQAERRDESVTGRDQWSGGGVNLGPRLDWRMAEGQTLQWQAFLQRNQSSNGSRQQIDVLQGTPPSIVASENASRGDWQMARTQLQWTRKDPGGQRVELRASAERSVGNGDGVFLGTAGSSAPLVRRNISHNEGERMAGGARLRWPGPEGHSISGGADLELRDRRELRRVIENGVELFTGSVGQPFDARMRRGVAFVQDEWTITPRANAVIGLRAEAITTFGSTTTGGLERRRSQMLAPIVQGRWALDDKGTQVLRASIARSSKLPDLSSLMGRYTLNSTYERNTPNTPIAADSAGNPKLQPERAWAVETSFEHYLSGAGVASVGVFHRRIDGLIRRRIALEAVSESTVPRWVSRPSNIGRAHSSGIDLELKGPAEHWLPALFAQRSGFQIRAALNAYRSRVEQIDDPDARLEGQPPWTASVGFDKLPLKHIFGFGVHLTYTPAYATQQTDLQRLWRDQVRRMDVYLLWRFSRQLQLRVSAQNADPWASRNTSSIEDLDGFSARSIHVREGRTQFNANLVLRF